ncbi:MAG: hypothetical protein QOG48_62 [Verrucomicrobiota bacterium]|jgi:hypothetical protein
MSEPTAQPERRSAPSGLANIFLPLLPVLACFLGGATTKWAEGVVLTLLGLYLLARPPRLSLGLTTNIVFVLFLAVALMGFLPAHWFSWPQWRAAVVDDFNIALPGTVSPQPWITAGAFVSLIGALSWLYLVATHEIDLRAVRSQLRLFVVGVVVLAVISILLYLGHGSFALWTNARGFGPFPNKNQTADLLGITSIVLLACGQDDIRRGRKRWFVWIIALSILVVAILLNWSRAGVGILVGGSVIWIFAVLVRQRTSERIALAVSFLLVLMTAVLLLGGETLERFNFGGLPGSGLSADFRWKIFHDTFDLIRASPWCGIGLGNFDFVFALFRTESVGNTRALHPESDWLWLWSEMGWPAVLLIVIGAALLVRRVLPLQEGTNQRFRLAALIAALIFAAHGLIDVSAHRVGTAFAGLFLLGLSLHRPLNLRPSMSVSVLFRIVGLVLVISGMSWVIATRSKMLLPGAVGVASAKELAQMETRGQDFSEAIRLTSAAIPWSPLDWQLYFSRAMAEAGAKKWSDALDDFRRARFLEPNGYELPFLEGNVWLPIEPTLAATAWHEALRRAGASRGDVYANMLSGALMHSPPLARTLEEIGLGEPELVLAYLSRVNGKDFDATLGKLLSKDPSLEKFTEPQKLALFSLWSERGNLDELARKIDNHRDWLSYAWFGMAKFYASKNDFHAAYDLAQRFGDVVALPRESNNAPLDQLQQRYLTNPDNYAVGYALYLAQRQLGRTDDALVTARHFSDRPNAPKYFHYLEAQSWAAKENWERAWNAWLAYHNAATKR